MNRSPYKHCREILNQWLVFCSFYRHEIVKIFLHKFCFWIDLPLLLVLHSLHRIMSGLFQIGRQIIMEPVFGNILMALHHVHKLYCFHLKQCRYSDLCDFICIKLPCDDTSIECTILLATESCYTKTGLKIFVGGSQRAITKILRHVLTFHNSTNFGLIPNLQSF